jgi:anti-anti-sigma factor
LPDPQYSHVKCSNIQDILILTLTEAQVMGDTLAEALRQEMVQAVTTAGVKKVIVDLAQVSYLSSVGFRPLLSLRRKLQDQGGRMVLCNLSIEVTEVFRATRMITSSVRSSSFVFEAQPNLPMAIASLNSPAPARS